MSIFWKSRELHLHAVHGSERHERVSECLNLRGCVPGDEFVIRLFLNDGPEQVCARPKNVNVEEAKQCGEDITLRAPDAMICDVDLNKGCARRST